MLIRRKKRERREKIRFAFFCTSKILTSSNVSETSPLSEIVWLYTWQTFQQPKFVGLGDATFCQLVINFKREDKQYFATINCCLDELTKNSNYCPRKVLHHRMMQIFSCLSLIERFIDWLELICNDSWFSLSLAHAFNIDFYRLNANYLKYKFRYTLILLIYLAFIHVWS